MCEKCVEIDGRIDHYGILESRTTDPVLIDGIKELIERLHDLKVALHPEQPRFGCRRLARIDPANEKDRRCLEPATASREVGPGPSTPNRAGAVSFGSSGSLAKKNPLEPRPAGSSATRPW